LRAVPRLLPNRDRLNDEPRLDPLTAIRFDEATRTST